MKNKTVSIMMLFSTALIWGLAFVAQSVGMDYVGPFTFLCVRSLVAVAVLAPLAVILKKKEPAFNENISEKAKRQKALIAGGALCGIALFMASAAQQAGIIYTSVGKTGFITALYIILVPLILSVFGKKPSLKLFFCVALALGGMYLLCISGESGINKGDALVFICAIFFSVHILIIGKYSPLCEPVALSTAQFFVCFVLSLAAALIFEKPSVINIAKAYVPILYAGVMSSGVAYTMQIAAQKNVSETVSSLILSLESVFSAVFGYLILGQALSPRQTLGCGIVFLAVILAQVKTERKSAS